MKGYVGKPILTRIEIGAQDELHTVMLPPFTTKFTVDVQNGAGDAILYTDYCCLASLSGVYTDQPGDGDVMTVTAGGVGGASVIFEFDSNDTVTGDNTPVEIGADADETYANLVAAIAASSLAALGLEGAVDTELGQFTVNAVTGHHYVDIETDATNLTMVDPAGAVVPAARRIEGGEQYSEEGIVVGPIGRVLKITAGTVGTVILVSSWK